MFCLGCLSAVLRIPITARDKVSSHFGRILDKIYFVLICIWIWFQALAFTFFAIVKVPSMYVVELTTVPLLRHGRSQRVTEKF